MTRDDRMTAFRHAASNRKGRVMAMKWFIIGWLTISVITFGWSAADTDERICDEVVTGAVEPCNPGNHAAFGMVAGLFWPLYWSWEIAEQVRS